MIQLILDTKISINTSNTDLPFYDLLVHKDVQRRDKTQSTVVQPSNFNEYYPDINVVS